MEIKVRKGGARDLPFVRTLVAKKEFYTFPGRGLDSRTMRLRFLEIYRLSEGEIEEGRKTCLFIAEGDGEPLGYCVPVPGLKESITDEPQCWLFDWGVASGGDPITVMKALVDSCRDLARSLDIPYLATRAPHDSGADRETLQALGFWEDIFLIIKSTDAPSPASPPITPPSFASPLPPDLPPQGGGGKGERAARRAKPEDAGFISDLNQESIEDLIPKGRDVDLSIVKKRYRYTYAQLGAWFQEDPHFFGFVVESEGVPAGYILIKEKLTDEFTGQEQGYIYDMAIRKESRGKYLGLSLHGSAVKELKRRGGRLITGEISASNRRALLPAIRHLGFKIERCRMVVRTGRR
ncbi:MAG: GNAT family N-acetyltransferase [Armatimonadetes bacterium]|nr:GNAT family N-acetyltransferase [Armatimonadota bacterium]